MNIMFMHSPHSKVIVGEYDIHYGLKSTKFKLLGEREVMSKGSYS